MEQNTASMDAVTVIDDRGVRPFRVAIPQEAIDDLFRAPRSWAERVYPQPRPFQQGRQRRALRGVGGAATLLGKAPSRLQIAPRTDRNAGTGPIARGGHS
jgi:hypothetical protein